MKTKKPENLMNDKTNSQAKALTDLPVTEAQARHAKGGVVPTDSFSVNFAKIEFSYKPQKD